MYREKKLCPKMNYHHGVCRLWKLQPIICTPLGMRVDSQRTSLYFNSRGIYRCVCTCVFFFILVRPPYVARVCCHLSANLGSPVVAVFIARSGSAVCLHCFHICVYVFSHYSGDKKNWKNVTFSGITLNSRTITVSLLQRFVLPLAIR